ncbi:hypothetical protein ACIBL8_08270 [Streptomyces sp. NPDC050523]|uniref:hypothetical protein n=1 Tax=Streptomyces sp. NPDC050523 TaxID=3365622 RepID=UPI0037B841EF
MSENTTPKTGTIRDGAERYRRQHSLDEYGRRVERPMFEQPEPDDAGTEVME